MPEGELSDVHARIAFKIEVESDRPGFFNALLLKHPHLSEDEIMLCGLLLFGSRSSEMATKLGKTVHAVNIARSKLNKKFHIAKDDEIAHYLRSLTKPD